MAEQAKVEKAAVSAGELQLPPYYNSAGILGILKRAQKLDPEWRHRMVKASPHNQVVAREKGWVPLEDKELAKRLGFSGEMITAAGRVVFMDCELWRMPMQLAEKIRAHISQKTANRRKAAMKEFDAMAAEVKGRTHGLVEPFAQVSDQVLEHRK